LRLTQDHHAIAGLERLQSRRPAVQTDECAWRGLDLQVATGDADHLECIGQDSLDRAGQASLRRDSGSTRGRRRCILGWRGRRGSGNDDVWLRSRGRRARPNLAYPRGQRRPLLSSLVCADGRGHDKDAGCANRGRQVKAESLEPDRLDIW
jgi:hypothetical protein